MIRGLFARGLGAGDGGVEGLYARGVFGADAGQGDVVGDASSDRTRRGTATLKWRLRRFVILFVLIPAGLGLL